MELFSVALGLESQGDHAVLVWRLVLAPSRANYELGFDRLFAFVRADWWVVWPARNWGSEEEGGGAF